MTNKPTYLITTVEAKKSGKKNMHWKTFDQKSLSVRKLINQALYILENFGIPLIGKTARQKEMMALSFLSLCDLSKLKSWHKAKSIAQNHALTTREIIDYLNNNFNEKISFGSYDDIRRKHLLHPRLAQVVIPASPDTNPNNPTRKWAVNEDFAKLLRKFGQKTWSAEVGKFMKKRGPLAEKLNPKRDIKLMPVIIPGGEKIEFQEGGHNEIQKAIIENFLPRYGYGANVIYVGDAHDKMLFYNKELAEKISLGALAKYELPDVIAYSEEKKWVYMIEAVHSVNPITPERILMLETLIENCKEGVIFVTAFKDKESFKKHFLEIAWETEVWIADNPDHLIHFDGGKFLGPYDSTNAIKK